MSFREEVARNRKDHGPGTTAILRRRALDLARRDTFKGALSIKLKRGGWNVAFLLCLLNQLANAQAKGDCPVGCIGPSTAPSIAYEWIVPRVQITCEIIMFRNLIEHRFQGASIFRHFRWHVTLATV